MHTHKPVGRPLTHRKPGAIPEPSWVVAVGGVHQDIPDACTEVDGTVDVAASHTAWHGLLGVRFNRFLQGEEQHACTPS